MDLSNKLSVPGFTANVQLPLVLDSADAEHWDHEADVVIVGFGGAGVVAALQARELGASVIAVDRFVGGGATAMSGGVVYAGGTRIQAEAGFEDNSEEMYKYISFEGTPVKESTLRRFCETSNENMEWLMGHGVQFDSSHFPARIAYPPDGYHLYYSGMEKFHPDVATPAPRGHRTVGKGPTGKNYFAALERAALEQGVSLIPHAPVRRLVVDGRDRVVGIEVQKIPEACQARHRALYRRVHPMKPFNGARAERHIARTAEFEASVPQEFLRLRARNGVILASGGYNYNLRFYGRYRPDITAAAKVLVRGGAMGCDGSGIELGASAGGDLGCMDRVFITKAISPPEEFLKGVLVNRKGERLISEDAYLGNVGLKILDQEGGEAWVILDSPTFWRGVRQLVWPLRNAISWWGMPALMNVLFGGTRRASTLEALAAKLGVDAGRLLETIHRYNTLASAGHDEDFGKQAGNLTPMTSAPFYAFNLSLLNRYGFSGSMPYGGLTVEEETGAVTRADGSVIDGLYAAGRTAVGVCSGANFSGLSIADTVFSGRRAVRAALAGK
ncbi:MAG: FAD-binding protein [Rhodospirillaceae bacterium]|nr:FAD-binding protein [Rhodospirillaceae bacterium]